MAEDVIVGFDRSFGWVYGREVDAIAMMYPFVKTAEALC
jgi:hypothetical protein